MHGHFPRGLHPTAHVVQIAYEWTLLWAIDLLRTKFIPCGCDVEIWYQVGTPCQ